MLGFLHDLQPILFQTHTFIFSPFNSEGALERAKRSVEQQYAVVGVLEDFNVTLTVFEHYIPRFFKGASDVYHSNNKPIPKTYFLIIIKKIVT